MTIATYADLLSAIQNYEDDTSAIVTDRDGEWVTLAEQRIHYGFGEPGEKFYSPPLRVRAMEQPFTIRIEAAQDGGTSGGSANAQTLTMTAPTVTLGLSLSFVAGYTNTSTMTLQPTGGSAVDIRKGVNNDVLEAADIVAGATYTVYYDGTYYKLMPGPGSAPLPARFLGFKHIQDDATKDRQLEFIASGALAGMEGVNSSGTVYGYTIDGDNIRLISPPDSTRYLKGTYYRRFAALSSELNELFRRFPGVYLYGTLIEAAIYLGEDENVVKWYMNYSGAAKAAVRANRSDRYGSGPLIQRVSGAV